MSTTKKHTTTMKLKKAIKILKRHQQWRLGADIKIADPKTLTQAIDVVLYGFELSKKFIKSGEIGDFEELKKL